MPVRNKMVSKIKIICIGKVKEKSIKGFSDEITKRIKPFCNFEIIELKDRGLEDDTNNLILKIKEEKLKNIFIMDEKGVEFTSIEFSNLIKNTDDDISFIIGGADGLSNSIKQNNKNICLSKMTFTHEMARLFLIEQIYRSMMIINNKKYHK